MQITGAWKIYTVVVGLVFGAVFGSFINCMAWRIVHHESFLKGRSHCAVCGHPLSAGDLVPVFSYLFLKGRCRYCGEKISPRYMITELLCAAAFGGAVLRFGFSFETLRIFGLVCMLLGLSLVDLDAYEIPDGFLIFGIIWWAIFLPLLEESWKEQLVDGLIGGVVIGGGMLLLSLLFDKITGKESLGGGDIKLFFVVGLYLGLWTGLFNLILSCIVGLVVGALMKKRRIPFGPAISLATYFSMLFGRTFTAWYAGLLGL